MDIIPPEDSKTDIVFLYKIVPGMSPKSYGFAAAKIAGLPLEVVEEAESLADKIQKKEDIVSAFFQLLSLREK